MLQDCGMDLEDFEENLRALDRTLSELQIAKRKSSQIDDQTRFYATKFRYYFCLLMFYFLISHFF